MSFGAWAVSNANFRSFFSPARDPGFNICSLGDHPLRLKKARQTSSGVLQQQQSIKTGVNPASVL
jgi:hypothetical protein